MIGRATTTNIKSLKQFLGQKVIAYSAVSVLFGLLQFGIDVGLAFSINSFFIALGLNPVTMPIQLSWLPTALPSVIMLLLVIATLRGLLLWMQTFVNGIALTEFEYINRMRIAEIALHDRQSKIAHIASLYNDVTVGASNVLSGFLIILSRIIVVVLLFGSLIKLSVATTLTVCAALLILILPLKLMSKKVTILSKGIFAAFDHSLNRLLMGVRNSLLLHIYNTYQHEYTEIQKSLQAYRQNYGRFYFISGLKGVLPFVFGVWLICFITIVSQQGHFTAIPTALLISYFYLFIRFVQSLGEIANTVSRFNLNRPRFVELWRWWQTSDSRPAAFDDVSKNEVSFSSSIGWQIDDLSFAYDKNQPLLFENLSLTIAPGSVFAVTGPSGRGKSTLLSLMLGLHKAEHGAVRVFDTKKHYPLAEINHALLDQIGYVGPDSFLIAGSLRDNLQYGAGNKHYSDDAMRAALAIAECDFALTLGLDHLLTEQGEGLSAGQKQRLMLARALLRRPKALILDEATANLDKVTEARIIETLRKLKNSMTIIAVTHKDALLALADQHLNLD